MPHVHLVEPVPLGGELGYYSGEDMPEKASMMAYSDVFLTVYSTMVVETAIHDAHRQREHRLAHRLAR